LPFLPTSLANHDFNDRVGYIPADDAYSQNIFQVLGPQLKPGCAENAIVNSLLDMMAQSLSSNRSNKSKLEAFDESTMQ
jgi:hypothetical protein